MPVIQNNYLSKTAKQSCNRGLADCFPFWTKFARGEQDCQAILQSWPPKGKLVSAQVGRVGQGGGSKIASNLAILVSKR